VRWSGRQWLPRRVGRHESVYTACITTPAAFLATLATEAQNSLVEADTIVPPELDTAERGAIAFIQGLSPGASAQLVVGEVIGEGGMGVIRSAEQIALGRAVAVKSLKPGHATPKAVRDLLREAWITGAVEHPGVVPVHYVELDRDGSPLVVLKKVAGTAWSALIRDAAAVTSRFGATDLLGWNLGILVQVLNALAFAHSRGILHRDLKPANVMIGDFGEVYLLDWGIAVSLRDDRSGRFPLASRAARQLAGTPGYMAPEMLGRDGDVLDERTDVYLGGAVLFEIVAGHPPHVGRDALSILTHIMTAEPQLPASAPAELDRICACALALESGDRFASVQELRLAVQQYIEHRGSSELADRAAGDLEALRGMLATASREDVYRVFGACRFGFHQALTVWRDNADAQAGLVAATVAIAEYELVHDQPRSALALLGEVDAPPELLARARVAAEAEARRKLELEQLSHDLDLNVHQRGRLLVGVVLGAVFTALPLMNHVFRIGYDTYPRIIAFSITWAAIVGVVALSTRRTIGSTAINRRSYATVIGVFIAQAALAAGAWSIGLVVLHAQILIILLWATFTASFAIHLDRRMWPAAIVYLLAFLVAARWPALRPYMAAASNFCLGVNVVWMWRKGRRASWSVM
jgi:eukaryotic-like serine/threonine-protein kinase